MASSNAFLLLAKKTKYKTIEQITANVYISCDNSFLLESLLITPCCSIKSPIILMKDTIMIAIDNMLII